MTLDVLLLFTLLFGYYYGYNNGMLKVFFISSVVILILFLIMGLTPFLDKFITEFLKISSPYLPFIIILFLLFFFILVFIIIYKRGIKKIGLDSPTKVFKNLSALTMTLLFFFQFSFLISFTIKAGILKPDQWRESSYSFEILETTPTFLSNLLKSSVPLVGTFFEYLNEASFKLNNESDNN